MGNLGKRKTYPDTKMEARLKKKRKRFMGLNVVKDKNKIRSNSTFNRKNRSVR
jgi:hypothetical protein